MEDVFLCECECELTNAACPASHNSVPRAVPKNVTFHLVAEKYMHDQSRGPGKPVKLPLFSISLTIFPMLLPRISVWPTL